MWVSPASVPPSPSHCLSRLLLRRPSWSPRWAAWLQMAGDWSRHRSRPRGWYPRCWWTGPWLTGVPKTTRDSGHKENSVSPPPYVLLPCHEESNRQTCGSIICFGARAPRNHDFFCVQYRGSQNFYFSVFFLVMDLHWQFGEVDIRAFSALSC